MYWITKRLPTMFRVNLRPSHTRRPVQSTTGSISPLNVPVRRMITIPAEKRNNTLSLPFGSIPGPTFLENLVNFRRHGIEKFPRILVDYFEQYGPIFKTKMPNNKTIVFVSEPDDTERVFRAEEEIPFRMNFLIGTSLYYSERGLPGGIMSNDESWYRQRSCMAPKFLKPLEIQHFLPGLCDVSDDSIALLKEGRNEDMLHHMRKWSTESIGFVTLGYRIGVNDEKPDKTALAFIGTVLDMMKAEAELFDSFPSYRYFKTPALKRLYRNLDTAWDITKHLMEKEKGQLQGQALAEKLVKDGRGLLSEEEIIQVIVSAFIGGTDSTSITAANTLYHLSKFPIVQEKLREEILRVVPNGEHPTAKHLTSIPYLRAVIKESLRVTPIAVGIPRKLSRPIVLGGFEVPAQTEILMSSFMSTSMATTIYGDFEDFRPERWLRESKSTHRFASTPFGIGRRNCVGRRVAEMEISVLLIRLLQRYEIQCSDLEEDKQEWIFRMALTAAKPFNLNLVKIA